MIKKKYFWVALIFGAIIAAPMASRASLSFAGIGYQELSVSQTSPNGCVSGNTLTGFTPDEALCLGGQEQTYQPGTGVSVSLFYRMGTGGIYCLVNLPHFQSASHNDWWDGSAAPPLSASVIAVPEPITLALPVFGSLVMTGGLARRFVSWRVPPVA